MGVNVRHRPLITMSGFGRPAEQLVVAPACKQLAVASAYVSSPPKQLAVESACGSSLGKQWLLLVAELWAVCDVSFWQLCEAVGCCIGITVLAALRRSSWLLHRHVRASSPASSWLLLVYVSSPAKQLALLSRHVVLAALGSSGCCLWLGFGP